MDSRRDLHGDVFEENRWLREQVRELGERVRRLEQKVFSIPIMTTHQYGERGEEISRTRRELPERRYSSSSDTSNPLYRHGTIHGSTHPRSYLGEGYD